jgi:gluconolactonase
MRRLLHHLVWMYCFTSFILCATEEKSATTFDFQFQKIASGIRGSEGPAVDAAGKIFVVSPQQGTIIHLEKGSTNLFARVGKDPCGLQIDEEGRVWIAQGDEGILRLEKNHQLIRLATEFEGLPIKGANDLALDGKGNLYFTVPVREVPQGRVFWLNKNGKLECFDLEINFPNGIAISPDGGFLVYAETRTRKLWRWNLDDSGKPSNKKLFAELPGTTDRGGDGMDFDAEGNLLATNYGEGSIDVFKRDGSLIERIMLPFKKPSNIEFIQGSANEWIITEHENKAVWKFRWRNGGSNLRKVGAVLVPNLRRSEIASPPHSQGSQ